MNFSSNEKIQKLLNISKEINALGGVLQLLSWDQETYMPKNALEVRMVQIGSIAELAHIKLIAPENGDLLTSLQEIDTLNEYDKALVREFKRSYEKAIKLPSDFVAELSAFTTKSVDVWRKAKEESNFGLFSPVLEKLFELKLKQAEYYGIKTTAYDALLDDYEPGLQSAHIEKIFEPLKSFTVEFLKKVVSSDLRIDNSILHRGFDLEKQINISYEMARSLGFNFESGRLDKSTHPFTSEFGTSKDVRITTRYIWDHISPSIMATIHETGHAMYEQGVASELDLSHLGGGISLGIHESQSRLWENFVGRSPEFWKYWYPILATRFENVLNDNEREQFVLALNKVQPGLIRVDADELTYNLHIIIRYEIEKALFNKEINVKDLPQVWNQKYKDYLGVTATSDSVGVLQDIHWASGAFGYFPTYTLGNIYAAQFWNQIEKEIPSIYEQLSSGSYASLHIWLKDHIYKYGKLYTADELCMKVTGETINSSHLIDYLRTKFLNLYSL